MLSPAVMLSFIYTGNYAEFMKGGMLMKSKHIATYGKKTAIRSFGNYHILDSFRCKSKITASAQTVI